MNIGLFSYFALYKRQNTNRKSTLFFYKSRLNYWIVCTFFITCYSCSTSSIDEEYTIRKGPFSASLVETGELQALKNNVIVTPPINWQYADQLKLTSLVEHGTRVKAGDIVAEIDKSSLMKTLLDMQNRLELEQTNLTKLLIQQSTKEEEIKTEIATQEASYSMSKLQLEKIKFESEKKRQIKKLEFDRATIALQKTRDRMKANDITSKKNIFIQKVKIGQIQNNIKSIRSNLDYFTIKAPASGMIEIRRDRRSNTPLKVGDRVWPGAPIASIPDMSTMKVYAKINETDIGKLKLGQKAVIRLQALPEKAFEGKVTRINPICYSPEQDSKVKVFDFEVLLNNSDILLKPGMSVSCEVFFAEYKKVFYVENECILRNDSASFIVLAKDHKYLPVIVKASNTKFTIIEGDLKAGDKVLPLSELQKSNKP